MPNRNSLPGVVVFALLLAALPIGARQTAAGTISGVVKDPAGAVIEGAQVSIRNDASGEERSTSTNNEGRFKFDNLTPGSYTISVTQPGFKTAERAAVIEPRRPATIEIRLEIAAPRERVEIGGKGTLAPNSEVNYRHIRDDEVFETYTVNNLKLSRDVGTLTLRSGSISFLAPVMNHVVKAVFVGDGQFTLMPQVPSELANLRLITERDSVDEAFEKAVLCFTDDTYQEIKRQAQSGGAESRAREVFGDFKKRLRHRPDGARSFVDALVGRENLDAELLAGIYNSNRPGFFNAYIFGRKFGDLRYYVRPSGALPQIDSPEEVALINVDPGAEKEGIFYLAHFAGEYKDKTASSDEDKRIIDVEHYRIETVIDKGEKLTAVAEVTFTALGEGDRILSFGLLPYLRVSRVTSGGREINVIQESRKEDGSFYVSLAEPTSKGKQYKISIEYHGDKVVQDAGGGNFAVGARTSWYPSVNAFNDRATFDLTFKVPKQYTLVGVGKLASESVEDGYAVSRWVSDTPLAVAGFNYGVFRKKEVTDADTKYHIEGYATRDLPDYLRRFEGIGGMTPSSLTDNAIVQAQNSMRLFTHWFGELPYGRIAITQQPQAFFGQSWPTLVYLPIISFFDSTQRWQMMGQINTGLTEFIEEVTPHEVSHQWWGHIVGWASYHDQWLSEGFADFSAGIYLQYTEKSPDKYLKYWEHGSRRILEKNQWGRRNNDAGPIWMGLRLNTFKTPGAYNGIVYPKGGYILHMLRSIMFDQTTGDDQFISMMKDFVKSYYNQNASTESFKLIVEKHMPAKMDLDGNKRMDWFFNEWVYGTEVPAYKLQYTVTPDAGKFVLKISITQSGVSGKFKMLVPVYLDFDGKLQRLGEATMIGNTTTPEFTVRLPQKPKRVLINAYHDVLSTESVSQEK
jgi:hypothetical protein